MTLNDIPIPSEDLLDEAARELYETDDQVLQMFVNMAVAAINESDEMMKGFVAMRAVHNDTLSRTSQDYSYWLSGVWSGYAVGYLLAKKKRSQ